MILLYFKNAGPMAAPSVRFRVMFFLELKFMAFGLRVKA